MGVTRQYISKLVRAGKVTRGDDGLIDYDQAVAEIKRASNPDQKRAQETREIRSRKPPKEVRRSADELDRMLRVATLKERAAKAQLKELEFAHKSGEYLKKSEVQRDARAFAEYLKSRGDSLGSRIALQLECEHHAAVEVQEIIDKEWRAMLTTAIKRSELASMEPDSGSGPEA